MSAILQDISEKLQKGKMKEVAELVKQAVADGIQPLTILNEGLMPGMDIIGERFKKNDIFIPEVLIAARAMAAGTDVLRPLLVGDQMEEKGTVVIGTIKDDLHDIGKNLVRMMMESKGLNVIDLGVDAGIVDKSGAWFAFGAEKLGQGKEKVRALLDETPELRNAIESQLIEHLGMNPRPVVHAPEETLPDPENAPVDDMDDEI